MKPLPFTTQPMNKEQLIEELVEDEVLREFFIEHDLDTDYIESKLSMLFNFKLEKDKCLGCEGLHMCKQDTEGFEPVLAKQDGKLQTLYQRCPFALRRQHEVTTNQYIDALYMPAMIRDATLEDFDFTKGENRTLIHNRLTNFVTKYTKNEPVKGLYLWGMYQQGKTYCLAALANELSLRGVHVIIAYYPDLVREFKSRINSNTVEDLISNLKQVEVLMLDDIGGENSSSWVRDEILGPILQYRLLDHKPTFFSSNLAQKQLTNMLMANNQTAEKMKAARIEERIKSLSEEIKL
jgi:primosomal protein DnaI